MKKTPIEFVQTRAILIASFPITLFALWLCIEQDLSAYFISILCLVQFTIMGYAIYTTRHELAFRLRSLTSVVEGMVQGDFSLKARQELNSSGLSGLTDSINTLSNELSSHKLANAEKRALLEKIITQIDIGVITADEQGKISVMNNAAAIMLNIQNPELVKNLQELNLTLTANAPTKELITRETGDKTKKLYVQLDKFREFGSDQTLILITDMNHLLRQEELKSWEGLVRVISHEINNSLAPIASLSNSLIDIIKHTDIAQDTREDIVSSAHIIADRAQSLTEFIAQYRNLTHIQNPNRENIAIKSLINPILPLFTSHKIVIEGDTELMCALDATQIKQVLINLLKNAVEAMQHPEAGDATATIKIHISRIENQIGNTLRLDILDTGCGIRRNQNLFIPFYTTKAQGSGIGLALSRQIIELHQGSLQIFNRENVKGCCARIEVPIIYQQ
jgi:two-component system, NtrC family, nitrogen regulation sensor histidine kinase NtrY